MADEKRNEKQPEVKGKTTESSKPEPKAEPEAPVEDKTKKRTKKEFKKLKKSNKQLKDKVVEYESVLDSLKPKTPPPPDGMKGLSTYHEMSEQKKTNIVPDQSQYKGLSQDDIDTTFSQMMDKEGYLDGNKLKDALRSMDQRAKLAERRAHKAEQAVEQTTRSQRDFEEKQVAREVHKQYPTLDPKNDNFNKDFFEDVRNEMVGQMLKGKEDFMEAATKVYNKHYKPREEEEVATKKEKTEAKEKEDAKQTVQAAKPTSRISKGYYDDHEMKTLKDDVLRGKKGALAEVLRRSGN